jgi:hypothetical protein
VKLCVEKGLNFDPAIIFSAITTLQLTRCPLSSSFWPKNITGMEYPCYFPKLAPNDLWLFPKLKSALKGRRFQDIEDIGKKKCDDDIERYSTTGVARMFPAMAALLD